MRQQRQNTRNLLWSLAASLGVVAALVLVVARPDTGPPPAADYREVARQLDSSAPAPLIVPELDESWSSNRAELVQPTFGPVWSVGLISTQGDYVDLSQGFGAPSEVLSALLPSAGEASEQALGAEGVIWDILDRRSVDEPGNALFVASAALKSGAVVISGTSEAAVLYVASRSYETSPELWAVDRDD